MMKMRIRWYIFLQVAIVVMPFIAQGQRCRTLPNEHKPFAQDALQSCQWKLSQHSLLDDNATVQASWVADSLYVETIANQARIYIAQRDTLYFRGGKTSRASFFVSSRPQPVAQMQSANENSQEEDYSAMGTDYDSYPINHEGKSTKEVLGKGVFITEDNDTIVEVTLIKETQTYQFVSKYEATTRDISFNRWYAQNDKLPLAIQKEYQDENGEIRSRLYVANREVIALLKSGKTNIISKAPLKELLSTVQISQSGDMLCVNFANVNQSFFAEIFVMDSMGNLYRRATKMLNTADCGISVETGGLNSGNYVVSIRLNGDNELTEKRIARV